MGFEYDFGFSFLHSPKKKEGRKKGERKAKIVIISHTFLLDQT
jgi:hypothetical protein